MEFADLKGELETGQREGSWDPLRRGPPDVLHDLEPTVGYI